MAAHCIHVEGFDRHPSVPKWMSSRDPKRSRTAWTRHYPTKIHNLWQHLGTRWGQRQYCLGPRVHVVWRPDTRWNLVTLHSRRPGVINTNPLSLPLGCRQCINCVLIYWEMSMLESMLTNNSFLWLAGITGDSQSEAILKISWLTDNFLIDMEKAQLHRLEQIIIVEK